MVKNKVITGVQYEKKKKKMSDGFMVFMCSTLERKK